MAAAPPEGAPAEQAEIYTHESDSLVYAMNWSVRPDKRFRLAVGTFQQDTRNTVAIIQLDEEGRGFVSPPHLTFPHPYPPTKLQWVPDKDGTRPDLLASSGDHLRLWRVGGEGVRLEQLLSNNARSSEFVAPVTSFDWNDLEPRRLATCSIDTSVTVWDVERGAAEAQLIAHDREVYDINWGGAGVFATVSADGSVRVFDLRDCTHSTLLYEAPPDTPLLHLGWNKQDPRYMATCVMDSHKVIILDIRYPTIPVTQLQRHTGPVNALAWAPHSAHHICTAGQDHQALIWDISAISQLPPAAGGAGGGSGAAAAGASGAAAGGGSGGGGGAAAAAGFKLDPILAYNAGAEVTQLQWSSTTPDWVAINFANKTQILRV